LVPIEVIKGIKGPPLDAPCDVAVDSGGRIVVADTGNDAVKIYPEDPQARPRTIGRGLVRQFSSPEGVAIDERGNIIVFDTGNSAVKIVSPEGRLLAVITPALPSLKRQPEARIRAPIAGCYLGKGYLAIADRGVPTYSLWRYDPASPRSETCQFIGYGPPPEDAFNIYVRDIAYDKKRGRLAYLASNFPLRSAAFLYFQEVDPDDPRRLAGGDTPFWLRVPLVGWVGDPAGLAFSPEGDLYITDAGSHSLQKIDRESFGLLNTPVSVNVQPTGATLKYVSTTKAPTLLHYGVMPGDLRGIDSSELSGNYADPTAVSDHEAYLTDLFPSTRYAYRHLLSRDFFCRLASGKPVRNFSGTMCFATQPAAGSVEYLNFPLRVLLFTNVRQASPGTPSGSTTADSTGDDADGPSDRQIEERVRRQLEAARLFFWANSRMTCNVKPDVVVVRDRVQAPLLPPLQKGVGEMPHLKDFLSRVEGLVKKHAGRDLSSSRNLFIIYAVRPLAPKGSPSATGGSPSMTCGLPYMGGAVSVVRYGADNTWSFITELRRQLSIMHLASSREDTLPSLLKDPGCDRSMVAWDSLADLLRAMGKQGWLSNRCGIFKLTRDEDEDGVPDDEPDCPLDEKRFGTSPRTEDSDGDGVSDMNEILASRWAGSFPIIRVLADGTSEGTRASGNHVTPSASAMDSDGDGVTDSEDRNPLCPLDDSIPKRAISLDGEVSADEWENAASMRIVDPEYSGVLRAAWSETHLCFSLTGAASGEPPSVRIRIDGAADGFLRGSDAVALVLEPRSDRSFSVRAEDEGLAVAGGGLSAGRAQLPLLEVAAAWSEAGGKAQVEIGLPKSANLGLNLFAGEEVAFDFELRPTGSAFWLRVFEPLTLFRGILRQTLEDLKPLDWPPQKDEGM